MKANTFAFSLLTKTSRFLCWFPGKSRLIEDFAFYDKGTALHVASRRGDLAMVKALTEARAVPMRNAQGRTPLEVARAQFGTGMPAELEVLLQQEGPLPNQSWCAPCGSREKPFEPSVHHSQVGDM